MTRGLGIRVTVLCEDRAHDSFVRGLLSAALPHEINVLPYPRGNGSGKAFINSRMAAECKSHLCRRAHQRVCLIVVSDADELSKRERRDHLLELAGEELVSSNDFLFVFIPKWSIETWFLVLRDDKAGTLETAGWTETEKLKNQGRDLPAKNAAEIFLEFVQNRRAVEPLRAMFPSLVDGIEEFRRFQAKFAVLGST